MNNEIIFDSQAYSIDSIRASSYQYWNICPTNIEIKDSDIKVSFFTKDNDSTDHVSAFRRLVVDNKVRLDVIKRTGKIRELIIAQAFAPVENLQNVVASQINEQ
jgi:His-Xaa-Ser system protein HxsD